jgi:hypothetical protein
VIHSARTMPAPYLQARRDGSPSQQQRRTAERPASPTPQLRTKVGTAGGPNASPLRASATNVNTNGYMSAAPTHPSLQRRSSQSSDAGDAGSYTSMASNDAGQNNARPRGASPMLRAAVGVPVSSINTSGPMRSSTPTRSWRF